MFPRRRYLYSNAQKKIETMYIEINTENSINKKTAIVCVLFFGKNKKLAARDLCNTHT